MSDFEKWWNKRYGPTFKPCSDSIEAWNEATRRMQEHEKQTIERERLKARLSEVKQTIMDSFRKERRIAELERQLVTRNKPKE